MPLACMLERAPHHMCSFFQLTYKEDQVHSFKWQLASNRGDLAHLWKPTLPSSSNTKYKLQEHHSHSYADSEQEVTEAVLYSPWWCSGLGCMTYCFVCVMTPTIFMQTEAVP